MSALCRGLPTGTCLARRKARTRTCPTLARPQCKAASIRRARAVSAPSPAPPSEFVPTPIEEFERKRHRQHIDEICQAGKRRGLDESVLRANIAQIESLVPGLVNLHRARTADWVSIVTDVNMFMAKLLLLKELFPNADLQKVLCTQPRLLLRSVERLKQDGQAVRSTLESAGDPDAIIQAVPDLIDPVALARSLSYIKSSFPGCDPLQVLARNPTVLHNTTESNIENHPEYVWYEQPGM